LSLKYQDTPEISGEAGERVDDAIEKAGKNQEKIFWR